MYLKFYQRNLLIFLFKNHKKLRKICKILFLFCECKFLVKKLIFRHLDNVSQNRKSANKTEKPSYPIFYSCFSISAVKQYKKSVKLTVFGPCECYHCTIGVVTWIQLHNVLQKYRDFETLLIPAQFHDEFLIGKIDRIESLPILKYTYFVCVCTYFCTIRKKNTALPTGWISCPIPNGHF